jgi:endonuclease-8
MPEGPEIRRAADRIARVIVDAPIEEVQFAFPRLRRFEKRLSGARILEVETRGKAMLTHFDCDLTIYSHNQLYGVWKVVRRGKLPATRRSLRLAIHMPTHSALLYSASDIAVLPRDELAMHPFLARIGPDIVSNPPSWREIAARLEDRAFSGRALGALYLDQAFLAGTGNYLRSEILYCAGLNPWRSAASLSRGERGRLARETLAVARRSYDSGGITLTPRLAARLKGEVRGYERRRFFAFARDGAPCYRCGTTIQRAAMSSRRIYWCSACQPEAA